MGLTKANGNMYEWVTHVHSHLRGACPHACPYCYVQAIDARFGSQAHQGPLRLEEKELAVRYGSGKVIFIEHTNDLFAAAVPQEMRQRIFAHCSVWPDNQYVFQTKNPVRMFSAVDIYGVKNAVPGVTVESDNVHVGEAPHPMQRLRACAIHAQQYFITIEPVLAFSTVFARRIRDAKPQWVNIGADSKQTPGLPQPTRAEVMALVAELRMLGVEVREKRNLEALR